MSEQLGLWHLCSHLKKEWKNGQPPWVRLTLAEYALKKPQVGGAAMLTFQNQWTQMQWSQMQGHPSYYTTGLEAELGEIELKVTTGYTLADAIREGASVTDQKIGGWIEGGESCALGAAWIAAKARGYVE